MWPALNVSPFVSLLWGLSVRPETPFSRTAFLRIANREIGIPGFRRQHQEISINSQKMSSSKQGLLPTANRS